jgi:hypothetical protein
VEELIINGTAQITEINNRLVVEHRIVNNRTHFMALLTWHKVGLK